MVVMTTRPRAVVLVVALALAASLLTLAVVLAKPAQAQAETDHFNERIPLSLELFNPCTEELITFDGIQHVVGHSTVTESGRFHFQGHSNIHGHGVSTSGAKYVAPESQNTHENFVDVSDSASNFTLTGTTQFIRQGSEMAEDDFQVKFVIHMTFNANGELTSFVVSQEPECK